MSEEQKNKKNKKINFWLYTFIIETIVNLFSSGAADYTLTEKEIEPSIKPTKKNKINKILNEILIAIVVLIIAYFCINWR